MKQEIASQLGLDTASESTWLTRPAFSQRHLVKGELYEQNSQGGVGGDRLCR
jgi:hypothetical protein